MDDVKPAITSMHEFTVVDRASLLFEQASGCQLHRDPKSGKVKFLPLGRWKESLQEDDIPVKYIRISSRIDMLGVKLMSSFSKTRKINCDELNVKLSNLVNSWKAGRFMPHDSPPLVPELFRAPTGLVQMSLSSIESRRLCKDDFRDEILDL